MQNYQNWSSSFWVISVSLALCRVAHTLKVRLIVCVEQAVCKSAKGLPEARWCRKMNCHMSLDAMCRVNLFILPTSNELNATIMFSYQMQYYWVLKPLLHGNLFIDHCFRSLMASWPWCYYTTTRWSVPANPRTLCKVLHILCFNCAYFSESEQYCI